MDDKKQFTEQAQALHKAAPQLAPLWNLLTVAVALLIIGFFVMKIIGMLKTPKKDDEGPDKHYDLLEQKVNMNYNQFKDFREEQHTANKKFADDMSDIKSTLAEMKGTLAAALGSK